MRISGSVFSWVGVALFGLLTSCAAPSGSGGVRTVAGLRDPGIIAIVPFFVSQLESKDQGLVRCPKCMEYTAAGEVLAEGPQVITRLFRQGLITKGHDLVPPDAVASTFFAIREQGQEPEILAQQLASEIEANSVLMGWIFRYAERVGSAWGARKPASVAFAVFLFDGRGRLLWRGKFDETQEALSENVLKLGSFVRRGGRWLTAEQLAADGVGLTLLTFPGGEAEQVNR